MGVVVGLNCDFVFFIIYLFDAVIFSSVCVDKARRDHI